MIDWEEIPNLIGMFAEQYDIGSPEVACQKIPEYVEEDSCSGEPRMWRPRPSMQEDHRLCHFQTRLADGRPALIVDPGSVGNLCGDAWAREVAKYAAQHNHHPSYEKRPRPLRVSGVGSGTQQCSWDCKLPIALKQADGSTLIGYSLRLQTAIQTTLACLDEPHSEEIVQF